MFWLGHGADPTPLTWDEVLATLGLASVTFGMLALLSYRAVLRYAPGQDIRRRLTAWAVLGAALVVGLLGAFLRSAFRQLSEARPPDGFHGHYRGWGGQVAMYRNYHIEVTRDQAGDYRVFVTDAYRRPISPKFLRGSLRAEKGDDPIPLEPSLDNAYATARLPREVRQVRLLLTLPEKSVEYRFDFEQRPGPPLPPQLCGER